MLSLPICFPILFPRSSFVLLVLFCLPFVFPLPHLFFLCFSPLIISFPLSVYSRVRLSFSVFFLLFLCRVLSYLISYSSSFVPSFHYGYTFAMSTFPAARYIALRPRTAIPPTRGTLQSHSLQPFCHSLHSSALSVATRSRALTHLSTSHHAPTYFQLIDYASTHPLGLSAHLLTHTRTHGRISS